MYQMSHYVLHYEKNQFVDATASKQKHPLQESKKNTKYVLSMNNYIYLIGQQ